MLTTTRPHARAVLVRTLAVIVAASSAAGCFTVFRHPPIMRMAYRRPSSDQSCSSCHSLEERRRFLRPDALVQEPSPWDALEHPWWIDGDAPADSARGDGETSR